MICQILTLPITTSQIQKDQNSTGTIHHMNDTTVRRKMIWESAANTNVGMVRKVNEDSILSKPEIGVWAVADGMGGYERGDVASKMIVQNLDLLNDDPALANIVDSVEDSLISANEQILEYAEVMLDNGILGSTIVTLIIRGSVGVCFWVGDSRLYRYRKGELKQLSRDHSRVEELIQQGRLTPEEAENHPESNVITRAVGVDSDFCVDINVFNVHIGDTFLLCSDGLYNMLSSDDIIEHMQTQNIDEMVESLVESACDNGAPDNVSTIVIKGEFEKVIARDVVINE